MGIPFYQKIVVVILQYVVPSALALTAALMANDAKTASNEVNLRLRAIQERLDERDLIAHESYDNNLGVPIGNDAMWRDYYDLVKKGGYKRQDAAREVLKNRAKIPNKKIAEEVWSNN